MSRDDETTEKTDDDRALDQRITEYLKLGIPTATLACALAAGFAQGAPAVVLVLAGGALVGVIATFWGSIRTLVGETPLSGADAYAIGAPRAEEEQKRAVLRALKDLEFERSVGKISEEDYQALVTKYRAEAKRLLRVIEEGARPERVKIEALIEDRLAQEGLIKKPGDTYRSAPANEADDADEPEARDEAPPKEEKAARAACAACGTMNDADAVFCKKCGAKQRDAADDEEDDVAEKEASS
jgi:hypothetical protein